MQGITTHSSTRCIHRLAAGFVFLTSTAFSALGQQAPRPEFPAGIRLAATARGEAAIAALGTRLPEVAAHYRKTPQELRALFRSDHCLHANTEGRLFYACELHNPAAAPEAPSESIGTTDPAPFPTAEAFLLHSRPGANRIVYLDFDGHVDNTAGYWKDGAASPAFDTNGDPAIFSAAERERIIYIWQRVAEDFAMFDIDVTTEDPGIEALRKSNSSDQIYGIRCVIGGSSGGADDWYANSAGGVAYTGTFDVASDVPCWVFPGNLGNSEKNIAEAASHEVGHTLGLNHDGTASVNYYSGHGNWAPVMGVGYSKEIVQWSKGEYTGANNLQDDLAVMLTQGAVYRPDDHGSTTATATVLTADTIPLLTEGVIEKRTDLDFFRISAAGGSLSITVKPPPRDSNLRIEVKLFDAAGALLQTANSADTSAGTQLVTLTRSVAVGDYYFSVDGIGNADPLTTGYSDYASLGQYLVSITGVLPAGATWLPTVAGSYQWNTLANWSVNPLPNAAGVTLRINNNIAGSQTINLATSATLGTLFLGDSNATHGFTVASTGGSLTFDNLSTAAGLSKTSGTNDVISAPLALTGELVVNQSSSGTLSLTGAVSGAGSLTKEGAGILIVTGAKTYSGPTKVDDGVLRLDTTDALPAGNLVLSGGGVLGLASGNFSRANGTGSNQVQWAGNGGFAAFGADRTVSPGTMSWASVTLNGNALILGHATADATLIWSSNLSFAGSARTIQVDDGSAAIDAKITSVLSGGGTFNKTGSGTLELTNANTYTATTSVNDGLLLLSNVAALPTTNLNIGGGILGLGSADLIARTIGTSTSQVRWTTDGGFAAFGATRAVKFSATPIDWTAANFIGTGRTLFLSHPTANATLDWQQAISLIDGSRTVEVNDGSADIDALMSGVISGGSAGNSPFNKTGEGTLAFTAQNTHDGDTIVSAGTLMIGNGGATGGVSQNSLNITVASGATLAVNRSDTVTQGSNALKVAISGDGDFSQLGSGTTILTLTNTYTGDTTINANSGTLEIDGAGRLGNGAYAGTIAIGSGSTFKYSSSAAQTLSGQITGQGALALDTPTANVTLTLSSTTNNYSGPTTITNGRINANAIGALSPNTAITIQGNSTVGGSLFFGVATPTVVNHFTISGVGYPDSGGAVTAGAIRPSNGQTFTGTITLAGNSRIGFISGNASVILSGRITGGNGIDFHAGHNANNLTQTFTLANTGTASDYAGNTSITAVDFGGARTGGKAILSLGANEQIPNGSGRGNVVFNGADANHVTILELNGKSENINGVSNSSAAGAIIRNTATGASVLNIGDANTTSAFSGVVSDGGVGKTLALTKIGTGTLIISGTNTYTGGTTVSSGTLAMGANNVLADTTAVSIGNATLNAATFTDTVGTLDVTSTAKINLGSAAALAFANSSAIDWTGGTLNLTGTFASGASLRFGTTNAGLTSNQLALITATGFTNFTLDANGYLTATAAGGFSSWITGTFANGSVPGDKRGPNDDSDNDGVSNLAEYAVDGQDPTVPNASIGSFNGPTLSFTKRAGTSGLTYAIQDSTDLGIADAWAEVTGGSYLNDATTIAFTLTPGTPAEKFLRLQVLSN